ncbi:acyl-CoA dehydrogenase [Antrihabitans sp. YC3-6]|uniref:Acyl-CoA dehydrogenase n=1 Tax=Antrihabitans stalagmiti TaxID=2799499 RepID=A0A934NS25_9NOCA|nr:acyl-CoA dehydrogenase [Antrihabitans stalagmiti]MBJ8340270.1 acyl-CoA dehydrogenase [Antrihabitans stalagmiti]
MSIATTDEQNAVQESIRAWARGAAPIAALRSVEADPARADYWRGLWPGVAEVGLLSVAMREELGGAGGTVVDLAAMLEAAATALVGGPVLSTALVGLILDRSGEPVAKRRGPEIADGTRPCAVVVDGTPASATSAPDGGLVLNGPVGLAIGAVGGADVLLSYVLDGEVAWCLVDGSASGLHCEPVDSLDRTVGVARVECADVHVAPDRVLTGIGPGLVLDLAVTLAAAEAAGVAGWCLDTAVDYAKIREQFGAKIGSFQAVKHLCAEMLCNAERARAVAWDAANAAQDEKDVPLAAAVAGAVALDAAVAAAKDCIQVLGGIGFTWEHDAHLYLRRATALRQLLGGSSRWRARVTDLSRAGARRGSTIDLSGLVDARAAIRADVAAVAALPVEYRRVALAENGLLAPHWPSPFGRDADPATQLLIAEELEAAGVESPDLVIGWWAIPTVLGYGSTEQIERHVLPTLRGEVVWCQLFSEPGAGSDLAALRTAATKVDGGWTLAGQKVWTSQAQIADWGICLARTDRDAPKHRGITYFLVDMRSAGIRISPLREITGEERFNEVFFDDVFVPDDCVVGAVDGGWRLANATLANERVAIGKGSALDESLTSLLDKTPASDAVLSDRLGALIGDAMVGNQLEARMTLRQLEGQDPGPLSSVRKLLGVRYRQDVAEFALDASGVDGAMEGPASHGFLLTRCLSIAGGTTQILLTVAAERILGLPRK